MIVVSQFKNIYKIGAYLYVFHEGNDFNWERRSRKFYKEASKHSDNWLTNIQSFNFPFLFVSFL